MQIRRVLIVVLALALLQIGSSMAYPMSHFASASSSAKISLNHVVVIVMEDEGIGNICAGSPPPCHGALTPYMSGLANNYGVASQYLSLVHQSLPNYLALLGGDTFNCNNGCPPINQTNFIDRLEGAGLTWKAYLEDHSGGCNGMNLGHYENDHNPFVQFSDILNNTERCNRIVNSGPAIARC